MVRQAIADAGLVIHVSSHSFTPELDGTRYETPILDCSMTRLDRARGDVCERWKASLKTCAPDLTVRRNYPYAGKGNGLTAWFRRHLPPCAYVGIELEVNQKHVFTAGRQWTAMRKGIIESLCRALANRSAGICR